MSGFVVRTRATRATVAVLAAVALIFGVLGVGTATAATLLIPLGTAGTYAAFGTTLSNTGATQLTGDVGTSPSTAAIAFPPGHLSGSIHLGDTAADAALSDITTAYNSAASLSPNSSIGGDVAGLTLGPGVYYSPAALSLSTTLTLDAQNNPTSVFVMQVDAAFAMAASSRIVLINAAQADHIFWQVSGAVSVGASASLTGIVLSHAAISIGANSIVVGRLLSNGGAVTLSSNSVLPQARVNLATADTYSALAATTLSNAGESHFSGDIGVSPGRGLTGFPPGATTGTLHAGDAEANQAQVDLHAAYIDAQDRTSTGTIANNMNGVTVAPGIVSSAGSVTLNSGLTLDGRNNPDSIFIFQINGSLTTAPYSRVNLINGADPNRIFWQVSGVTTLGVSSIFIGSIMGSGSIAAKAGVALTGRVLSLDGSVTIDTASSETLTALDLGTASKYSLLAATQIDNTGPTQVNFNVGVSPGTVINGFPPGTSTNGTLHAGDANAAQARSDAYAAYTDATQRSPTRSIAGDLGGLIFPAGVYAAAAAISVAGTVTLDARGDPGAVFIFQVGAAYSTAAGSNIALVNGAKLTNVFWQVLGASTLGADSNFTGTLISTGAVDAGAGMKLAGRLISLSGAVALGNTTVESQPPPPGTITATSSPTTLSDVTIDGISNQVAKGSSDGWSVADYRGSGAAWSLTIAATDFLSQPGSIDTVTRMLPASALSMQAGPVTATSGSDPIDGVVATALILSSSPQSLLSSAGPNRGTYLFSPTFMLVVPPTAYRSNFSGEFNHSPLNPYVTTISITIS